jgi:aspartyl-tRNA(Asn)/glutamyl-tRNA(Gln) amidotransferase subunit A
MSELALLSAVDLRTGYAAGDFSPVEVVDQLAGRITSSEPELNAFMTLTLEQAKGEARKAEQAYTRDEARPLEGIPFATKDLFDTAGIRTTYGSPMFDDHRPVEDAVAIRRAREAGAILVGKTSTDEFAYGITSVNPHYGPVRNPWDPNRVSGGSSGGSAVALAVHDVPLALGSDTGGSIRAPSSFCGIVGFKPSYGVISTRGLFAMARSFDHPGPMARSPLDVALFLGVLADFRPWDRRDDRTVRDLCAGVRENITGIRVGHCEALHPLGGAPDICEVFESALGVFQGIGGRVVETTFPDASRFHPTHAAIRDVEVLFTHRRAGLFPSRRQEYSEGVYARLERATKVSLDDYLVALDERQRLWEEFEQLFETVDVIVKLTSPSTPLPIDTPDVDLRMWEKVSHYTVPENVLGLPTCVVRAGFDSFGLPVGVQVVGRWGADPTVLRVAQAFYEATEDLQCRWP